MPHTRYLLWNDEDGIYLGSCLGFGFWSQLDPAGQEHAVVFETAQQALEYSATWDQQLPVETKMVQTEEDHYATIAECVAAGLPRWDPNQHGSLEKVQ